MNLSNLLFFVIIIFHINFFHSLNFDIGVLLPSLNPYPGFNLYNGTIIQETILHGVSYVNTHILSWSSGNTIGTIMKVIGDDMNEFKVEDPSQVIDAYISMRNITIGIIGPSFTSSFDMMNNYEIVRKPVIGFAQKTEFNENKWFLRMNPSTQMICDSLLSVVFGLGIKKISILYDDTDVFSKYNAYECEKKCQDFQIISQKVKWSKNYSLDDTKNVLFSLQTEDIEGVLYFPSTKMSYYDFYYFFNLTKSLGIVDIPWFTNHVFYNRLNFNEIDEVLNSKVFQGLIYCKIKDHDFDKTLYFEEKMTESFGDYNFEHFKLYFDAVIAYGEAISLMLKSEKDPNIGEDLMNYLFEVDVIGSLGRVSFVRKLKGERSLSISIKNIQTDKISNLATWSVDDFFRWSINSVEDIMFFSPEPSNHLKLSYDIPLIGSKWIKLPRYGISPENSYGSCSEVYSPSIGSEIFLLFGGSNGRGISNELYEFNLKSEDWELVEPRNQLKPPPLSFHTCQVLEDYMFSFGGINDFRTGGETYIFHLQHKFWIHLELLNTYPPPRYGHASVKISSSEALFYGGLGENSLLRDIFIFNLDERKYTEVVINQKISEQPKARYHHSLLKNSNDQIIIFGGTTDLISSHSFFVDSNDLWSFNLTGKVFTQLIPSASPKPIERSGNGYGIFNDVIYIFFGYSDNYRTMLNDIYKIDVSDVWGSLSWEVVDFELSDLTHELIPRLDFPVVEYDDKMIIFGGLTNLYTKNESSLTDMWIFNIKDSLFSIVHEDFFSPVGFAQFASVISGEKLIIFGGKTPTLEASNIVYEFDLISFEWKQVEVHSILPDPRFSSCFTSVGNTLYIYGGINDDGDIFSDFFQYSTSNHKFKEVVYDDVNEILIGNRYLCSMDSYKDHLIILLGGIGYKYESGDQLDLNEYYIYNTEKRIWTYRKFVNPSNGPLGLIGCSTVVVGSLLYTQGCQNGYVIDNNIYSLNIDTGMWKVELSLPEIYATSFSTFTHITEKKFLLFGGETIDDFVTNLLIEIDLYSKITRKINSTATWSPKPKMGTNCHYFQNRFICAGGIKSKRFREHDDLTNDMDDSHRYGIVVENYIIPEVCFYNFDQFISFWGFPCSKGTVIDPNQLICNSCKKGTYNDIAGSSTCFNCSAGFYGKFKGLSSRIGCLPCPYGFYSPLPGSDSCIPCSDDMYCPLGSHKEYETEFLEVFPIISHPEPFQKNVVLTSSISISSYSVGIIIWLIVSILIGVLWKINCLKMGNILWLSCLFKAEHEDESIKKYHPTPKVEKPTVSGLSDEEIHALVPLTLGGNDELFKSDISVNLFLLNYQSVCNKENTDECEDDINVNIGNIGSENKVIKCIQNPSLKESSSCVITVDIVDGLIGTGEETFIEFSVTAQYSFTSMFDYNVSTTTGYYNDKNQKSTISGSIVGNPEQIFRGIYPSTMVTLKLLKTEYTRTTTLKNQKSFGYHLDFISKTEGNQVFESDFPDENGFSFKFSFEKSGNILQITRFNENTIFTFIPVILGSSIGIIGLITILYTGFEKVFTCIGCKNDITEVEVDNKERIRSKYVSRKKDLHEKIEKIRKLLPKGKRKLVDDVEQSLELTIVDEI